MKPILEDIQKTMPGVEPVFNHHMSVSDAIRKLGNHFFEIGMKLKSGATPEQLKKYKDVTNALVIVRGAVSQNFIHEGEINAYAQNEAIYLSTIAKLKQEIKKMKNDNEIFNDPA